MDNSLDKLVSLIAMQLTDVSCKFVYWFPPHVCERTIRKVRARTEQEGLGFLTKAMPRLGKALDRALSGTSRLDASGWQCRPGSDLPKFMGEAFERVFFSDGWIRPDPCTDSIVTLRQILFCFYKLETSYEKSTEEELLADFISVDESLPEPTARIACQSSYAAPFSNHRWYEDGNCAVEAAGAGSYDQPTGAVERHVESRDSLYKAVGRSRPSRDGIGQWLDRRTLGQPKLAESRGRSNSDDERRLFRLVHSEGAASLIAHGTEHRTVRIAGNPGDRMGYAERRQECLRQFALGVRIAQVDPTPGCRGSQTVGAACSCSRTGSGKEGSTNQKGRAFSFHPSGEQTGDFRGIEPLLSHPVNATVGIPGLSFTLGGPALIGRARKFLAQLLCNFDPTNIVPRHGPGSVSTGEHACEKMRFKRFYTALNQHFPYDAYFYASPTHVCDEYATLQSLEVCLEGEAKVCFVPKDSRGPRIISMEPLEYQWIQQGILRALVPHIEGHPLTRGVVNFTDQSVNRSLAMESSITGAYATLDLKEASDRVSLALVRNLFPASFVEKLEAVRSTTTILPHPIRGQSKLRLRKWAPMGSALCFPVLALTIWSIASAVLYYKTPRWRSNAHRRVFVYGDDVITATNDAADVMAALEYVDLKINRNKSYATGFFKESCGMDAFRGVDTTPQRVKVPWSSTISPTHLLSWIDYSNRFYEKGYYRSAEWIAEELCSQYGALPRCSQGEVSPYPAFKHDLGPTRQPRRKWCKALQRYVTWVWYSKPVLDRSRDLGWCEVLRYYVYAPEKSGLVYDRRFTWGQTHVTIGVREGVRAGQYPSPKCSELHRGWR